MHEPPRDRSPAEDHAGQSRPDPEQPPDEWTDAEISARPPPVDPAPQLVADIPYYYRAGPFAALACCRIRIWERYGEPPVVMATELPDNPGMSITNAAEYLATDVWELLGAPEREIVWIEHYPERGPAQRRIPEEFDRVTFTQTERGFAGPQWRRLSRAEVEALLGGPLEEGRTA